MDEKELDRQEAREQCRIDLWWSTYNAAVTGLCAHGNEAPNIVHTKAVKIAEEAHGPLVS